MPPARPPAKFIYYKSKVTANVTVRKLLVKKLKMPAVNVCYPITAANPFPVGLSYCMVVHYRTSEHLNTSASVEVGCPQHGLY